MKRAHHFTLNMYVLSAIYCGSDPARSDLWQPLGVPPTPHNPRTVRIEDDGEMVQ